MAQYKPVLFLVAAIAAVIGLLGLLDLGNAPYAGFFLGPNNDLVRIFPGAPAETAGLAVGDVVRTIGGIAITDTRALARRHRPSIGETRTFVVERDGQEKSFDLTYSALPRRRLALGIAAGLIGFCFLLFPLFVFGKVPSDATFILALFGLCFGIAFLPGPYSQSYFLRTLGGAIATSAVIMAFAFLVHYLLSFPEPRGFLRKTWAKKVIYGPAIFLAIFFLFVAVAQPDATTGFNRVVGLMAGVFVVGFFGWAIVAMTQRFLRASAEERSKHGLTLMLGGTLLGLLPVTFSNLMGAIAPDVRANLPGVLFYFLTLVLIPLSFAIAAMRSAANRRT